MVFHRIKIASMLKLIIFNFGSHVGKPMHCPHHWWHAVEAISKPPYKQTCS